MADGMESGTAQRAWRNRAIVLGVAGLFAGFAVGAAGGGDTTTTTETQTVVSTAIKRVPVVHVRTVRTVRRVVRTQTVTVEAPAAAAPTSSGSDGSQYAGLNCSEIGHSFTVTPGSDPEHDADNDGIACESY